MNEIKYEIKMVNQKKNFFCQIGNCLSRIGEKHTFWHWEWGQISAPKSDDREPWLLIVQMYLPNIQK